MYRPLMIALFGLALLGCSQFPQVDAAMQARGPAPDFPTLAPIESVLMAPHAPRLDSQSAAALGARAERLRARAARLRRDPVVSVRQRQALLAAVQRRGF